MRSAALTAGYEAVIRPVLFRSFRGDPERVHEAMITALAAVGETGWARLAPLLISPPHDPVTVAGIRLPGRVGVAAGLDKDGVAAKIWARLGFGFAELGTVTANPQPGNPRPRLFRLTSTHGLINRMGFNNQGAQALADRLAGWGVRRGENTLGIPVGISIGKTKTTALDEAVDDYIRSMRALHTHADYLAVNVSSPNTPGLRSLQSKTEIFELVSALVATAADLDPTPVPVFVKVAPDLSDEALDELSQAVVDAGASGLIATNTTVSREGIARGDQGYARQTGGMSGAALTLRSRQVVARALRSGLPVIASGGIMTVADARAMLDLGAAAVQVYTGFIYRGPGLVAGINDAPVGW